MDFRVTPIQRQCWAQLRNTDIAFPSWDCQAVVCRIRTVIISVSDDIESCRASNDWRCCNEISVDKAPIRTVQRGSSEVCRRSHKKISLQFCFGIFLPGHCPILRNHSAIIVARVPTGMAEIAPICPAVCHIDVENCDSKAKVVLIEDTFKLLIQ